MTWKEPAFATLADALTAAYGMAFPPLRRAYAEAAMQRAIARMHEPSAAAYCARLEREPALLQALVAEVTVGETYFFRDPQQFDALRDVVLPDVARRGAPDTPIRVWSAGCSTGEEAYSLAILGADCGLAQRLRVCATDASTVAIEHARNATYGAWSFRREGAAWRDRCFERSGKSWTVAPRFRVVTFGVHNLQAPAPLFAGRAGGFDLIVCRNVFLYFETSTIDRALHLLADALAPGGWLMMSPTDPPVPHALGLESVATPAGIIFRRPLAEAVAVAVATPAPPPHPPLPIPPLPPRTVHARTPLRPALRSRSADAEVQAALALSLLDARHPHQAAVAARRALYLDRTLAIAHLTLARALRLTGSTAGAQRALLRSAALLERLEPHAVVRGAGGASAGTLSAVAAAEFDLLMGAHSQ
jgi:chemotaxis protein methyltransferase CheR